MPNIDYDKLSDYSEKKLYTLIDWATPETIGCHYDMDIHYIFFEKSLWIKNNNSFNDINAFYWYLFYEYLLSFGKEGAIKRIGTGEYIEINEILESEWYKNYLIRKEGCLDITQID